MDNQESTRDQLLQIKTEGRDDTKADAYHHPYEPTPYCVLERLADSGLLKENDVVLDYGCGKGRVGFFLSFRTGAKTIGIEYDDQIYQTALENKKTAISKADFVLARAETYAVPENVTGCYFFNPFSVELLRSVMARIIESYYTAPREMLLFFYYPSDEYMCYLTTLDELEFYDEIDCIDLFDGNNSRERIMIFRLPLME
jgi:SAM-dependent methyltransferase